MRPLIRVDVSVFRAVRDAATRQRLLGRLKQLGTAFMMFAQDHNETFPGAGGDLGTDLGSYLNRSGALDGFVYEFPGGSLSGIAEPAKTALGHAPGPKGTAVLFADGHVEFRTD